MKYIINKILLSACFLPAIVCTANAQQTPGSSEMRTGGFTIAAGTTVTSVSETLTIGSGTATAFQTDGLDSIFSKNVWISPNATITGAGSMSFNDPTAVGGTSGVTTLDGNNNTIAITNVSNNAPSGIQLKELLDQTFGTDEPDGTSAAALTLTGNTVTFGVDGANFDLNGSDLTLGSATSFVNPSDKRMVITDDNIASHLIKQNLNGGFFFPVGIQAGDYTPATVTPANAVDIYVSVKDFNSGSVIINDGTFGMYRMWHIYGSGATTATLTLQHNAGSDGNEYDQAASYITDYTTGKWSTSNPVDDDGTTSDLENTATNVPVLAANDNTGDAFYSVTSMRLPLSVSLAAPLTATLNGGCSAVVLSWTSGVENNFDHYTLYTSTDGKNFTKIIAQPAAKGSGSSYSFAQANPASGINYYQLTGTDKDGSVTIYGTTSIDVACAVASVNVYPNPATTQLNVIAAGNGNYQLMNEAGTSVLNGSLQAGANTLNVSNLSEGMYILHVTTNGSSNNYKVVIKK